MPEEIKRKRGRPPKSQSKPTSESIPENDSQTNNSYEFNSFNTLSSDTFLKYSLFSCGIYDYFSKEQIKSIFIDPIENHETAISLSNFVYTKNGVVSNSIDYMAALPCLDRIIINKNSKNKSKLKKNKEIMKNTLKRINDRSFIRDALFTDMTNGTAFYYFDVRDRKVEMQKYLYDYVVQNITEINEIDRNIAIVSLPWKYTKIVGKKNGRYVLAFDLKYFDNWDGDILERKLRKYPPEIITAYDERRKKMIQGDWVVLDNDKTMCVKIKCKDSEPWGRSLIVAALEDVLYKDYYTDTKRNVLDEVNTKIFYQTFPEGREKGSCALTSKQQQDQHDKVKQAIMNKNNRGGINFISVAAGTKLDSIKVDTDIFDSKNESDLNNNIAVDLGICASLIGAMATGNYAAGQSNLEMITAQLYTWVYEWQKELNYVINKNIIQDVRNEVEVYYFPTSFVNKSAFFGFCKDLYMSAGGSLSFLVASAGIDPDAYFSVLDQEIDDGVFQRYLPHETSYTLSKGQENSGQGTSVKNADEGGRPKIDNPTNENTIASRNTNGNAAPSPSDK